MAKYTVSSSEELLSSLKHASSGDTILLASGTYSNVQIRNLDLSGVTITSADSEHPATFTDFNIRGSSGITISNVNLTAPTTKDYQTFLVYDSKDIHFDGLEVSSPSVAVAETGASPFFIRASENVSVTNSEFHHLWHGISLLDTTNVVLTGNYFHDIRTDGIRGGGNSNLLIDGNVFTDFYPAEGDHADGIQLWTAGTSKSAHDIVISNNIVLRGAGQPIQGIYANDNYGNLPFLNLTISDNLVIGGSFHGIAVSGAIGGIIEGNTVLGLDGQRSWIRAIKTQDFEVDGNNSTFFVTDTSAQGALAGNTLMAQPTDKGAGALVQWLTAHGGFSGAWGSSSDVAALLGVSLSYRPPSEALEAPVVLSLVSGTSGADRLKTINGLDTRIEAGDGNDTLTGGTGRHNVLVGGKGDDNYMISNANDTIVELAGEGADTVWTSIDYRLSDTVEIEVLRLTVEGLTGIGNALNNRLVGSGGADRMYGMDGDDLIQGVGGDDWIDGGNGNDDLRGDDGNDIIFGGAGNDLLQGGDGNDVLDGGAGDDVLDGGAGADFLTGAAGADTFQFRATSLDGAVDRITDFTPGVDKISLRLIDAVAGTPQDDAFKFIGQQAFHHVAGELRFEVQGQDVHVTGDVNGDAIADFTIVLQGLQTISANNFLL